VHDLGFVGLGGIGVHGDCRNRLATCKLPSGAVTEWQD